MTPTERDQMMCDAVLDSVFGREPTVETVMAEASAWAVTHYPGHAAREALTHAYLAGRLEGLSIATAMILKERNDG